MAQAEGDALTAQIERFEEAGAASSKEIGPNGATIWHVQAGTGGFPATAQSFKFLETDLSVRQGDTVIWDSEMFHNVTFHPGQPEPAFIEPIPQEQGPPIISMNPQIVFPQKPAETFDGTGFWSSGLIGIDTMPLPGGKSFAMTFSKPGTYDYVCAIHAAVGMKGSITVTDRAVSQVIGLNAAKGEFPEDLAVDGEGNIYASIAPTGEIKKVTPQGAVSTFAQLPAPGQGFVLGLEFASNGDLYVANASSVPEDHGVWRVSADGSTAELFASLPMEVFPNVLDIDKQGNIYVSDTSGGGVWKVDPEGNASNWKTDGLMMGAVPPSTPLGMSIGSNGVNLDKDEQNLYVAVTEFNRIVRIPVNADGSAGAAEVFVEDAENLPFPDGMAFGPGGDLYVASVGADRVLKVSPEGAITTLDAGTPLQNPSDVEFGMGDDAGTLYIANFALFRMLGIVPETARPSILKLEVDVDIPAAAPLPAVSKGRAIPQDKGYLVEEISDGLYWMTEGAYQVMFMTTGEGVIVVDAPPSIGEKVLQAIADVTDEPITHVIYSHSHADHIAAAGMYPADAIYIAHEDTADNLARSADPDRAYPFGVFVGGSLPPAPAITFSDSYTLTVGSQTLELEYKGPNHNPGSIFIYAPEQKVLMLVDVIFPGWSPFLELAISTDPFEFIKAHDDVLSYDFETMVSGHLGRTATRQDVETQKEYILDIQDNAAQALSTVDFFAIAAQTGFENAWLLFGTYLDAVATECTRLTNAKWTSQLGGADLFTNSHCGSVLEALRVE